jgi:hypothetical protein
VARRCRRYLPRVRCTATSLRLPARIVVEVRFLKKIWKRERLSLRMGCVVVVGCREGRRGRGEEEIG